MTDKERVDMIYKMVDAVDVLTGLVLERKESEKRDEAVNQLLSKIAMQAEELFV